MGFNWCFTRQCSHHLFDKYQLFNLHLQGRVSEIYLYV